MDKPAGVFKCRVCKKVWEGKQLLRDPSRLGYIWLCGNPFCGALVEQVTAEQEKAAEQKAVACGLGVSAWIAFL